MIRTLVISALCAAAAAVTLPAQTINPKCAAGRDLVVQALEKVTAASATAEVHDADLLLQRAASMCPDLGDAWYYRSVMEARLGRDSTAQFALERARFLGSDAMRERSNPFILSTPSTPGKPTAPPGSGTRWALVIGISSFKNPDDQIKYAADDARLFAATLLDPQIGGFEKDHVLMLLDGDATYSNIKEDLNAIARQAKPEDTVVIYVATHGSPRDMDSVGGVNYLITANTDTSNEDKLWATGFPMADLVGAVANRIQALRTAIFIDTCYSGGAHGGQGRSYAGSVSSRTLDGIRQGSGRIIMTASREDQESQESDTLRHGYFTYYLVSALRDRRANPMLSALFTRVQSNVSTQVALDLKNYHLHQDPVFSRSSPETDFTLLKDPAVPGPATP